MRADDGFVAIRDLNPRADTHLLVLPERHVDTFREVGEFLAVVRVHPGRVELPPVAGHVLVRVM